MSDIIDLIRNAGSQSAFVQIGIGVGAAAVLVWYLIARSAARRRKQEAQRRAEDNARSRNA